MKQDSVAVPGKNCYCPNKEPSKKSVFCWFQLFKPINYLIFEQQRVGVLLKNLRHFQSFFSKIRKEFEILNNAVLKLYRNPKFPIYGILPLPGWMNVRMLLFGIKIFKCLDEIFSRNILIFLKCSWKCQKSTLIWLVGC